MSFQEFTSMEEMAAHLHAQEEAINAEPWTKMMAEMVDYGSYWTRYVNDLDVWIFGYVYTLEELEADERQLGAGDDEVEASLHAIEGAYERGYRFGICYSTIEPDGELGSTHVSSMTAPLTPEKFELFRKAGWRGPKF